MRHIYGLFLWGTDGYVGQSVNLRRCLAATQGHTILAHMSNRARGSYRLPRCADRPCGPAAVDLVSYHQAPALSGG